MPFFNTTNKVRRNFFYDNLTITSNKIELYAECTFKDKIQFLLILNKVKREIKGFRKIIYQDQNFVFGDIVNFFGYDKIETWDRVYYCSLLKAVVHNASHNISVSLSEEADFALRQYLVFVVENLDKSEEILKLLLEKERIEIEMNLLLIPPILKYRANT